MTRRTFNRSLLAAAMGSHGCAQEQPMVIERVKQMELSEELAIIEGGRSIHTVDGQKLGRLSLEEGSLFPPVVSPDGDFIAWYPPSQGPRLLTDQQALLLRNSTGANKAASIAGPGGVLAISSEAAKAAVVVATASGLRLDLLDINAGNAVDLSGLLSPVPLRDVQRLRFSADGTRLVVGSEESWHVLDVTAMKPLGDARGTYPSISPSGDTVAFVADHMLYLQTVSTGESAALPLDISVDFAAGWSPNGRFLLVGGLRRFPTDYRLLAVEVSGKAVGEVRRQEDEIVPEIYWIKRRFALTERSVH
jgi:hypothetical protein